MISMSTLTLMLGVVLGCFLRTHGYSTLINSSSIGFDLVSSESDVLRLLASAPKLMSSLAFGRIGAYSVRPFRSLLTSTGAYVLRFIRIHSSAISVMGLLRFLFIISKISFLTSFLSCARPSSFSLRISVHLSLIRSKFLIELRFSLST